LLTEHKKYFSLVKKWGVIMKNAQITTKNNKNEK